MMFKKVCLAMTPLLFAPCLAYSQPTIGFVANTSTLVQIPANRQTYVQYKVTNNTKVTRTLTMVPIPNVSQVTGERSECGNPFVLAPNQSCNLTLYVNGSVQRSNYAGGPVVCATKPGTNTPNPFYCSQPEQSIELFIYPVPAVTPTLNKLYVSNWDGGSISLCYINDLGHFEHCLVSAVSDTFVNPEALAINGQYLYVANIGGGMSSCSIDTNSGELTNCQNSITDTPNPPVYGPDGIAIQNSTAYISNSGLDDLAKQGVTICTVDGPNLKNCNFTRGDASFSIPSDLALFNNTVYVTNFESQTTYCTVDNPLCINPNQGQITGTGDLLSEPEGLFITAVNGSDYAYFTNHGNHTVTLCKITTPTTFVNCANTAGYFTGFGNLALLNSSLKAYIPSGLKTIAVCDVNPEDATLRNCVDSNEISFNNPSGLAIL